MQEKTMGVVLRALKYGDSSLIVDIYTASRGTVPFIVKVAQGLCKKRVFPSPFHS